MTTPTFTITELYTDHDGLARFRERVVPMLQGSPLAHLSELIVVPAIQFRHSPLGFKFPFHCSPTPQWVFILSGEMEIGLQDGTARRFKPGEHFLSADTLPPGETFNDALHGHRSCQVGDQPLVTLFVKTV